MERERRAEIILTALGEGLHQKEAFAAASWRTDVGRF